MATAKDLEEEAAEKAMRPKPDPFEQDARTELRKIPGYLQMEKENRKLQRQIENLTTLIQSQNIPDKTKTLNNGGPAGGWGNMGGLASAKIIQYATKKYLSGEWTEQDIERYLFHEEGWIEKAGVRARQIVKLFSKMEKKEVEK